MKGKDDTLNIFFEEKYTDDYANKTLNNKELYQINLDKAYEIVKLLRTKKKRILAQYTYQANK